MASLFLSHSSVDSAVTAKVAERLRAAGFAALFVDFDPDQGIPVGRNWERELYAQLRRTDALIFLASEASLASRWCFAELSLARSLGRPVFPLRLRPNLMLPLLDDVHWIDLPDPASDLAPLLAGLRAAGLDPADSFSWDPQRSPYPGLVPFAFEDAAVFFGRQPETSRLLELLTPTLQRAPGRFVAVVGPSGSGKSSLLHAGLIPRLARHPERWVLVPPLRPGRLPTAKLAGCLTRAFADRGGRRSDSEIAAALGRGPVGLVELARQLAELATSGAGTAGVLLAVDQAEELLTRTGGLDQQAFLNLLRGALDEDSPIWVVATLRSEFLSTSPDRAGLAEAVDDTLVIEPLSRNRLAEVIARPAQVAGLEFAPGLIERMVEDTVGGDALPLLGYTLHQLSQRAGPDGRLTEASYDEVGGVVGALRLRAGQLTEELTRRELGPLVLPTLTRLATVSGDEQPTRRRVRRDEFSDPERVVVDAFVDASLLVSDQDPARPDRGAVVEVAHEALLRQWPPLHDAIEADRGRLRLRSDLEQLAADWQHGQRDEAYLLRGIRLAAIDQWAQEHPEELDALERAYVDASRGLAARELNTARRSVRRLYALTGGLALLLVVALVAGGLAINASRDAQDQARVAREQTRLALSKQLAGEVDVLVDTRPDLAILGGLQSLSLARSVAPEPPQGLIAGMARVTHASRLLTGHLDQARGVAFSPDGSLLATTSDDRTVRLWDVTAGRPHGPPLTGHTGAVYGVAFSPDGSLLATTGDDRTVRLWDVTAGQPHGAPLIGHTDRVWDVAFSPDGDLLATAGGDRSVRLWDVTTGRPHGGPLIGHTDTVWDVAFSPDGDLLATASGDTSVRLWDVTTGQPHGGPLTGHTGSAYGVAFGPDGDLLASASGDTSVRLWDVTTGQPHGSPLTGHTGSAWGVAFSPDGDVLASTGRDQTVRLWDVSAGLPRGAPLPGHTNSVWGVAFSPRGDLLATTGADRTVRLWDVAETISVSRLLQGHGGSVNGVAVSPDGDLLATSSDDQSVQMWDVASGRPYGDPLTGHTSPVFGVAFSPDGTLLATTSADHTVRLWDVATAQPHGDPLTGHTDSVWGVAFDPAGTSLATTSDDRTVRLWDVATGQPSGDPLTGHSGEVWGVAFSPDGRLLATASADQTVRLWDVARRRPVGDPLTGHSNPAIAVAFSPDGRLLATTSGDQSARLWDVSTGQPQGAPLTGHVGGVLDVAFSPGGDAVATASEDGTVRLWDVATGRPLGRPLAGHTGAVWSLAFGLDGTSLATGSEDGTARLWSLSFDSWLRVGCGLINRNMSMAEWNQLLPGVPYERTCPGLPAGEGTPPDAPAAEYSG